MGLADRFKKVMGLPDAPDPLEPRRRAFREAAARGDEAAAFKAALGFSQSQHFDEALNAFAQLEAHFPARKAEWLRWQGQTLYIGMGWRMKTAAERVACHERALQCYFAAAELGDRSQEFNVVELCEALAAEPGVPAEKKRAACQRYLALFPDGAGRKKVEQLLVAAG